MRRVPIKPATDTPATIPVGVDGTGSIVSSTGSIVPGTPEVVLDVCEMPLVVVDAEPMGTSVLVTRFVGFGGHSPANQESYIPSSVPLQDEASPLHGGFPCEQIQFLVYSRQAFSCGSSKHLRAQDGTPASSIGFTDGHWVAYHLSVLFQHA